MKKLFFKLSSKYKLFAKILSWLKLIVHKRNGKYKEVMKLINIFCDMDDLRNSKYVRKLIKDIYFSNMYYKIDFKEYFLYNFEKLSDSGRKEFIGDIERNEWLETIGNETLRNTFLDKYKCYLKFKKYYKRDIVQIDGETDKKNFDEFCQKHSNFIVKPVNAKQGDGVYKVNLENDSREKEWKKILRNGRCVLEEFITQTNDLGNFHPESVNTVRFVTYTIGNKVIKLFACLRIGQGNSMVDNASAGGIVALIDIETGIICTLGKTYNGKTFIKHPDTNVCIVGYQIPKWNEICNIAEEAAKVLPEYNYISWDFALTDKGWVIVEANHRGAFWILQMFSGYTIRNFFQKLSNK